MRMKSAFPELRRKMARLLPLRYTDEEPYAPEEESAYGLLGGRVGPAASRSAALSASVGSVWRSFLSVLILGCAAVAQSACGECWAGRWRGAREAVAPSRQALGCVCRLDYSTLN